KKYRHILTLIEQAKEFGNTKSKEITELLNPYRACVNERLENFGLLYSLPMHPYLPARAKFRDMGDEPFFVTTSIVHAIFQNVVFIQKYPTEPRWRIRHTWVIR